MIFYSHSHETLLLGIYKVKYWLIISLQQEILNSNQRRLFWSFHANPEPTFFLNRILIRLFILNRILNRLFIQNQILIRAADMMMLFHLEQSARCWASGATVLTAVEGGSRRHEVWWGGRKQRRRICKIIWSSKNNAIQRVIYLILYININI